MDKKQVLIVVDMQNDFISGSLGSERGKEIVPRVCKIISEWSGSVIATMDTHGENYLETQEGKHLPVPHCIIDTWGWEIESSIKKELLRKEKNRTIEKGSFGSLYLPDNISLLGVSEKNLEIMLVGLCTDICVVSNALILKAAFPEAKISVDASCCGGVTPEKHKAALETMKSCQIEILNEEI